MKQKKGSAKEQSRTTAEHSDGKWEKSFWQIMVAMQEIYSRALEGNSHAIGRVVDLAQEAVSHLRKITDKQFELVRSIAEKQVSWPIEANLHPHTFNSIEPLLKKLGVGKASPMRLDRKSKWNPEHIASQTARWAVLLIYQGRTESRLARGKPHFDEERKSIPSWVFEAEKLPDLSPKTASHWWPFVKQVFLGKIPHPEEIPQFRSLVFSKKKDEAGKTSKSLTYPSEFRRSIVQKVQKAFFTIYG